MKKCLFALVALAAMAFAIPSLAKPTACFANSPNIIPYLNYACQFNGWKGARCTYCRTTTTYDRAQCKCFGKQKPSISVLVLSKTAPNLEQYYVENFTTQLGVNTPPKTPDDF